MMRTRDPEIVWEMLRKQSGKTQVFVSEFVQTHYQHILDGLDSNNVHALRRVRKSIRKERQELKKYRRRELIGLRRTPNEVSIERNTWFHLTANADQQYMYCLNRMLDPIIEHVDNGFSPIPKEYREEYEPMRRNITELLKASTEMISTGRYDKYDKVLRDADSCKDKLSTMRKNLLDTMTDDANNPNLSASLIYLNTLQESQELLSIMRHHLRATNKFTSLDASTSIDDLA